MIFGTNRVLFRLLFRRHRLAMGLSALVPLLIGGLIGAVFPTYERERALAQMAKLFKFSDRLMGGEQMSLFSSEGALSLCFQHPFVMMAAIVLAAIPALGLPAGERNRGALDMVLATPLRRSEMVRTVALLQALTGPWLGLAALMGTGVAYTLGKPGAPNNWAAFPVLALDLAALVMVLAALALLISVRAADRSRASLIYGLCAFGAALWDIVTRFWREIGTLSRLGPFGYVRPAEVLARSGGVVRGLGDAAVLLSLAFVLWWLAVRSEDRRRSV
ncbi:MAG: ABC transporter permease subunit [Planctomycetes bacterium]|nr:ABC transporter permease subunit [Planctomycetota bacterium]